MGPSTACLERLLGMGGKLYIETFGCQMNIADSEVVASILADAGYELAADAASADLVLINTCSVRDHAEQRVWGRLDHYRGLRRRKEGLAVGVIGCMGERLGRELLAHPAVSLVAGPDSYRDLPSLAARARQGEKAASLGLSETETYDRITPVRMGDPALSGFVTITRGCNNFCTYCIVPYTRGRERSRDPFDILAETTALASAGFREVTLLGQNVNSYLWKTGENGPSVRFSDLLARVAAAAPGLRIRFTTSHPKDMSDDILHTMARYANICRHIHLPVQSGSSRVLKLMNRRYDRESYLDKIRAVRSILPGCGISTDLFCGFPGEREEDHLQTLELMKTVRFDLAFMFRYSERPGTYAQRHLADDVPEEVKLRRLDEIIRLQNRISLENNRADTGKTFEVLVEGNSKKSKDMLFGRTSQNKVAVFPRENHQKGDLVRVTITGCTQTTLIGVAAPEPEVSAGEPPGSRQPADEEA